jgi:hypothetical protein
MERSGQFKIACYLAWCGAEATFPFASEAKYKSAIAFLDKITGGGMSGDRLPAGYARGVGAYYFVDEKDRDAFQSFMRDE